MTRNRPTVNLYFGNLCFGFALAFGLLTSACGLDDGGPLTPAREIEGTWATSIPATFFIKTDFCSELLEDVASEKRMLTLIITSTSEYTVDIEMRHESSGFTVLDEGCNPTGYVPDVSPNFLSGFLSSTELTVKTSEGQVLGSFAFTTDLIEGTWSDLWCMVYCQNVYTEPNAIKLIRQ